MKNFCILHMTNQRNKALVMALFLNELSFHKWFGCKGCFPLSGVFKISRASVHSFSLCCVCVVSPRSGRSELSPRVAAECASSHRSTGPRGSSRPRAPPRSLMQDDSVSRETSPCLHVCIICSPDKAS